jgi:hypothetical protein
MFPTLPGPKGSVNPDLPHAHDMLQMLLIDNFKINRLIFIVRRHNLAASLAFLNFDRLVQA